MSITKCPVLFPKLTSKESYRDTTRKNKEEWNNYLSEKKKEETNELLSKIHRFYELSNELGIEVFINLTDYDSELITKDTQFKNSQEYNSINPIPGQIGVFLNLRILRVK